MTSICHDFQPSTREQFTCTTNNQLLTAYQLIGYRGWVLATINRHSINTLTNTQPILNWPSINSQLTLGRYIDWCVDRHSTDMSVDTTYETHNPMSELQLLTFPQPCYQLTANRTMTYQCYIYRLTLTINLNLSFQRSPSTNMCMSAATKKIDCDDYYSSFEWYMIS